MIDTKPWWKGYKYSHIKIPKALFKNPEYANISSLAILLYGFLLDRTSLSYASGKQWQDNTGNFFVYFPLSEISARLSCGHDKATAILKELVEAGLIRRTRQKPGSPYKITVLPFDSYPEKSDVPKWNSRKSKVDSQGTDPCGKPAGNKTEDNNPDINNHNTYFEVLKINEAVARAKENGMPISEYTLRRAIRSGQLPCRIVGRTYLITWTNLVNWVSCVDGCDNAVPDSKSKIRKICS